MKKLFTVLAVVIAAQFGMVLDQIKPMVDESRHEELTKDFNETLPSLYEKMADVYMEEFTHDDIKQILAFYESEFGQKLGQKQGVLMEKAMKAGEQWGLDLQVLMMKYME